MTRKVVENLVILVIFNNYCLIIVVIMDKKERFAAIYSFLKNKGKIHNQTELAKAIGASEATISKALKGDEKSLTDSLLNRVNRAFGNIFSFDWMMNGVEPMLCCYKNSDPNAPFLLGEPEPGEPSKQDMRNEIEFLRQQLKLEKDKNDLLQQQLNLYEGRV